MNAVDGAATASEVMAIAASRMLRNDDVCFVGIGAPSLACNLALQDCVDLIKTTDKVSEDEARTRAIAFLVPGVILMPSGVFAAVRALQGGRISVGFLGGAQLDRFANINSSVIGSYDAPTVRLPGGGGAPEIAALCRETYVVMPQTQRTFVERVDFVTSFGFGTGGDQRRAIGIRTAGPTQVVTDLCLMRPDPATKELTVVALHPGVTHDQVRASTGWPVRFVDHIAETPPPTTEEREMLRDLQRRTERAHAGSSAAGAA